MIHLLSIDRINGKRVNKEVPEDTEPTTLEELEKKRKRLLAELKKKHPDLTEAEQKAFLDVNFQYRDDELNPDPRFMPAPVCICGKVCKSDLSGTMVCECGQKWYDWRYDLKKWKQK